MYTKKEREYYNEQRERSCQRLGITKNQYNWLRRKGQELHYIYVADCNGELENESQCFEDPIYKKVNEYVKKLGLFVYYQTDPRGATIYIDKVEIPDNNYNQAVCVY